MGEIKAVNPITEYRDSYDVQVGGVRGLNTVPDRSLIILSNSLPSISVPIPKKMIANIRYHGPRVASRVKRCCRGVSNVKV